MLLVATAWALLVPPWQAPDEPAHFAYGQLLAERLDLPGTVQEGGTGLSTELSLAWTSSNAPQVAQVLATKPEWSPDAYARWRAADRQLDADAREDGTGFNPASTNPPLYYLYAAPAYVAAGRGNIFDRLYLMRIWSALLLLATCVGTWLLAGELFSRNRPLQLLSAAVVGLQPMNVFISSSVSPDGLLFALWSFALWLGVRVLRRGSLADAASLFGVVGLAVLVKGTSYALVPAALFAVAVAAWRRRGEGTGKVAGLVAAAVLAFAVPAAGWFTVASSLDRPAVNEVGPSGQKDASLDPRTLSSYLWQFYFPRLPSQTSFGVIDDLRVYSIWVKTGWAAFGWLEVRFPWWVYALLGSLSAFVIAGGALLLVALRWSSIDRAVVGFFGVAGFCLLAGLHWVEYKAVLETNLPFAQGRYLFPLLPLFGAAVAGLVGLIPRRGQAVAIGIVLGALFTFQLFSLGLVAGRYFA